MRIKLNRAGFFIAYCLLRSEYNIVHRGLLSNGNVRRHTFSIC